MYRIGQPRQTTLKDSRQLLYGWSAMAAHNPQVSPRERCRYLTKGSFIPPAGQQSLIQAEHCEQRPWRKLLLAGT